MSPRLLKQVDRQVKATTVACLVLQLSLAPSFRVMAWSNQGGQGAHGCQKLRCSKVTTAEIGGRIPVCSERLLFSIFIQKSKLFFARHGMGGISMEWSVTVVYMFFIIYCTMATEQKYNFHPSTPEECLEVAPEGPVIAPAPGFWDPGQT